MYEQTPFPGFARPYIRYDLYHRGHGVFDLCLWRTDGPGFLSRDSAEYYEALSLTEAMDVVLSVAYGEHGAALNLDL